MFVCILHTQTHGATNIPQDFPAFNRRFLVPGAARSSLQKGGFSPWFFQWGLEGSRVLRVPGLDGVAEENWIEFFFVEQKLDFRELRGFFRLSLEPSPNPWGALRNPRLGGSGFKIYVATLPWDKNNQLISVEVFHGCSLYPFKDLVT